MSRKTLMLLSLVLPLVALDACGSDKQKDDASGNPKAAVAQSADEYRKQQAAFADSVLNTAAPPAVVAKKAGKGYEVGSTRLRDTLQFITSKSDCFPTARQTDPYLAGTVSFFVNMSVIGSDIVGVQESKWTSAAGNIVDACLNGQAKKWKFDGTFGKPATYVIQVQFR